MKLELGDLGWSGSSAHGAAMGRTQAREMLDGAARHARHSRLSARHAEQQFSLSLSVELGCNEHQQPAVWLVAVAHEARWSRAETPRTRAAAASGQQTCKQCCSKRASQRLANVQANVPAAASGS